MCDYELITVDATTPRSSTYAATTRRAFFVVGGNQRGVDTTAPRPGWCGREPDRGRASGGLKVMAAGSDFIEFGWEAVEGATGYEIHLSLTPGDFSSVLMALVNTTMHRFSGLAPGTTGYARMRPHYEGESGDWSETVTGTTMGTPPPPEPEPAEGTKRKRQHVIQMEYGDMDHFFPRAQLPPRAHLPDDLPLDLSIQITAPDGFVEPFIVSVEYSTWDILDETAAPLGGLTADDFTTEIQHGDGSVTTGTGRLRLEMCVYDRFVVTATTAADATYAEETTRTAFVLAPSGDGREWDSAAPRCSGPTPPAPPRSFVVEMRAPDAGADRWCSGQAFCPDAQTDPAKAMASVNSRILVRSSHEALVWPMFMEDAGAAHLRAGESTPFVHVHWELLQRRLVDGATFRFERVEDETPTGEARYITCGMFRCSEADSVPPPLPPQPPPPVLEPQGTGKRRHFVQFNGQDVEENRERIHFPLGPQQLPEVLEGPFVLTLEHSSPDGPLIGGDFTTGILRRYLHPERIDGAHPAPHTTGTGSIRLELCDYEEITISATTPGSATYAEETTSTNFIVGTVAPPYRPYWCGRKPPPFPGRLKVVAVDADFIEFGWDAVEDATHYDIEFSLQAGDFSSASGVLVGSTTLRHRFEVAPGTTGYARVRAVFEGGRGRPALSGWSETATGTSLRAPPPEPVGVPRGLKVVAVDPYFLEFGWEAVEGAIHYHIQFSLKADDFSSAHGVAVGETTLRHRFEVVPGTTGYARVQSLIEGRGWSEWSETATGTSLPPPEPKERRYLVRANGIYHRLSTIGNNSIRVPAPWNHDGPFVLTLEFSSPDGPDGPLTGSDFTTQIRRYNLDSRWITERDDGSIRLSFCDYERFYVSAIAKADRYYKEGRFEVEIRIGSGRRGQGLYWCFPKPPPEPVGVPGGLRVFSVGQDFIEFQWGSVEGATHYQIQFSLTPGDFSSASTVEVRRWGNTHRFEVAPGTTVYARVRAVIKDRWSEWSRIATGTSTPLRRHFVSVNGGEAFNLSDLSATGADGIVDGHRREWLPESLPTDLDGPYVLTLEFSSPDGPLTAADFSTRTHRMSNHLLTTDITGTGSIRLELCDYEEITVIATTAAGGTYPSETTRLEFIVGGDPDGVYLIAQSSPNWCSGNPGSP